VLECWYGSGTYSPRHNRTRSRGSDIVELVASSIILMKVE